MKDASSSTKTGILIAIILVLSAGYYFYTSGGAPAGTSSLAVQTNTQPVGSDVLALLNTIHSLSIDPTFFQSQVYRSLVDFTVAIPPENIGRPNPFAAYSGNGIPASTSSTMVQNHATN